MTARPGTIGRYLIDGLLGQGAMGVVYKGHDPVIDRPVAIKLVRLDLLAGEHRQDYLARFRQEVQAAGRCVHANIVTIYDFGEHDGAPFFAMEYVDGRPLDEALPRGAGLGPQAAGAIALQLLDALGCAHALGVVHRDVKPANMLLTGDRRIKVLDFGISGLSTSHLTQAGLVMGTPSYMAPEQLLGEGVGPWSDLYAAGVVLHELLTGRTPDHGRSVQELMARRLHREEPDLAAEDPLLPPALRAVLARALARDPDRRFPSAAAMALAVRDALAAAGPASAEGEATVVMPAAERAASLPPTRLGASGLDDPALVAAVERRLAEHMGPIAGRMLREALRDARSADDLCQRLAAQMEAAPARERFLSDVRATLLRPAAASRLGQTLPGSAGTKGGAVSARPAPIAPLSESDLAQVRADLARHLGPIAGVLVKRAASSATSLAELRERLAEHLDNAADRAAFLAGR